MNDFLSYPCSRFVSSCSVNFVRQRLGVETDFSEERVYTNTQLHLI